MAESVQTALILATQVANEATLQKAPNGLNYASFGDTSISAPDLARMVQVVPAAIAAALARKAYYFVPLALADEKADERPDEKSETKPETQPGLTLEPNIGSGLAAAAESATAAPASDGLIHTGVNETAANAGADSDSGIGKNTLIAAVHTQDLLEQAICHRNVTLGDVEGVFISTRLLSDRFALAFEFFINIGHAFVDAAGVPAPFAELVWTQALADVRGETSQDAWESRALSIPSLPAVSKAAVDEKARLNYMESAFSDAIAIYLLSLSVDFDYSELREREYPLLAPRPLADRLRSVAKLFPPNSGYEFAIRYRRRA
jgi:hypothetical protein